MKHKLRYFSVLCILCILCILCAISCSHIDEDERYVYVKPADALRSVLIEDFTGQRCVNCPKATEIIKQLQDFYGEDKVVAVAIHSGEYGHSQTGKRYEMTTEVGEEYYDYWGFDHQPVGIVNRQFFGEYSEWLKEVGDRLQQKARVQLSSVVKYDESKRELTITVQSISQDCALDGKLQLWLTEDGITAFQYQPDGSNNREYVHNHVFRDVVNGMWGTNFHIEEGEIKEDTFTYTIPEDKDWKVENMHVVAFVYTDIGVEQVETFRLKMED